MGQVITEPRPGGEPGPGTRGAQRREAEQQDERGRRGNGWRVVAFLLGVAVTAVLAWVVVAQDDGAAEVMSASEEAAMLTDEKDALLAAGTAGTMVTNAQETETLRQEKPLLAAAANAVAVESRSDEGVLQDEKIQIVGRATTTTAPEAPTVPLTEQQEKELLLAG